MKMLRLRKKIDPVSQEILPVLKEQYENAWFYFSSEVNDLNKRFLNRVELILYTDDPVLMANKTYNIFFVNSIKKLIFTKEGYKAVADRLKDVYENYNVKYKELYKKYIIPAKEAVEKMDEICYEWYQTLKSVETKTIDIL